MVRTTDNGLLAQMGERLLCKQEVASSSLARSTNTTRILGAHVPRAGDIALQATCEGCDSARLHQI